MSGKLVMGNWKMNARGDSARALVAALLEQADTNRPDVVLAPPAVYLAQVAKWLKGGRIGLAAQDVSRYAEDGAYTGEVNARMLADVGCGYALVGHSERRQYFREDNEALLAKVKNAQAVGLLPVLCVGETLDERESGRHLEVIHGQLEILGRIDDGEYIVAYEPVWAIGTGRVATLAQIAEMHGAIKKWCLQNTRASANIRVLYGGSVKAENAETILATENVDGALVGGASLDAGSFRAICQAAGKLI